jgi:hypothetical protein
MPGSIQSISDVWVNENSISSTRLDAGVLPFLKPGGELLAAALTEPAEMEDAELSPATLAQARDALQRPQIVVVRWTDEDPDPEIGTLRLPPVIEPVHKLLETREWQSASLALFRVQTVTAAMRARCVPQ